MDLFLLEQQNNHRLNLQENFRRAMLLGDGMTGVLGGSRQKALPNLLLRWTLQVLNQVFFFDPVDC